ncbi:MAG: hypothetical protein GY808_09215, partial [Gammaproteobacteria bacterium]|nr:hypothetical protein [Gammaproteobacteria bacterium]
GADEIAIPPVTLTNHFMMRAVPGPWTLFENSSFGTYTPILRIGLQEPPPLTILSIADARIDNDNDFVPDLLGQIVTVQGIVTTPNFSSSGTDYFIQDATAAINFFTFSFAEAAYNLGDEVQVTGEIQQYNGKAEIVPTDVAQVILLSTGNPLPAMQEITLADVGEDYEGELIITRGVWFVDPGQWPSAGSNANMDLTDGTDTLTLRIDKETDVDDSTAITGKFDLIAAVGQFDSGTPPDGGYQVFPRFYSDFLPLSNDLNLTFEDASDISNWGPTSTAFTIPSWDTTGGVG